MPRNLQGRKAYQAEHLSSGCFAGVSLNIVPAVMCHDSNVQLHRETKQQLHRRRMINAMQAGRPDGTTPGSLAQARNQPVKLAVPTMLGTKSPERDPADRHGKFQGGELRFRAWFHWIPKLRVV